MYTIQISKHIRSSWPWPWHSRSLKVKCHAVIGLAIYAFLLMVNSNIRPNLAPLRYIRLWNLGDFDFDLSRSLTVKSNGADGLSIYEFLSMCNCNHMPISHRLDDMHLKIFFLSLIIGPKFCPPPPRPTFTPGLFFSKSFTSSLGNR